MRWVVRFVKWLLWLLLTLVLIAFVLPASRHIERSREIAVPPERVWALIVEPRQWSSWQPWYAKDPGMKLTYSGPDSGTGAQWAWESATQGVGRMRFERADAPRTLEYQLEFKDTGSMATGRFRLDPSGAGTKVTWAFDTDLGMNPLMRWFGLGLDHIVGPDFEAGLDRLAAAATKPTS